MQPLKQLRSWHALVAVLATAAYLAEDAEPWHQLLGYGVAGLIAIRVLMAIFGSRALGLQRFYPKFRDLKLGTVATHPAISRTLLLGIAVCLLGVTTTGILMDRGKTLQPLVGPVSSASMSLDLPGGEADDDDHRKRNRGETNRRDKDDRGNDLLEEVHELFANLLIAIVAMHVVYLVLFKWPLARFMLFADRPRKVPLLKAES